MKVCDDSLASLLLNPLRMLLIPPILFYLLSISATRALQIPFLSPSPATAPTSSPRSPVPLSSPQPSNAHTLTLRHAFHSSTSHRHLPPSQLDYSPQDLLSISSLTSYSSSQSIRTKRIRIQRPNSQEAFQAARRANYFTPLRAMESGRLPSMDEMRDMELASTLEWEEHEIEAPDTEDVETLAAIGKMTSNAYTTPDQSGWNDIGAGWNRVQRMIVSSLIR